MTVKSNHAWYTLSGIISRFVSFLAVRWADSPNDLFPVAVFVYGIIELFGLRRSVKILLRFHAKQTAKVRKQSSGNKPSAPASSL